MSNIYITEPPTSGKVLMKTTVGDIDIELWAKEAPRACRNFIQLAMEGYFNNTIFHRVVKNFIVQGGDSTGTGLGGDSIYNNEPFKDEFHSRLKFNKRGLVALANAGKDDNKSQFFFTMASTPELNNKHTIFGKVTGPTIFNMLKLQEGTVDHNERPEQPKKIISIEILKNPFNDIIPREIKVEKKIEEVKAKSKSRATKNFKLLSFGEEAEEEENDLNMIIEKEEFKKKDKSLPELIKDESINNEAFKKSRRKSIVKSDDNESDDIDNLDKNLNDTLKDSRNEKQRTNKFYQSKFNEDDLDNESDDEYSERRKQLELAQADLEKFKKNELKKNMIEKHEKKEKEKRDKNPVLNEFKQSNEKYLNKSLLNKTEREQQALKLLEKFKNKLKSSETADETTSWLKHKLKTEDEDEKLILAKDANLKNDADWYEVHDPRNIITKTRREMDAGIQKSKKLRKDKR